MNATALAFVLKEEGGFNAEDPGGGSMRGILQSTYDGWRRSRGLPVRPVRQITDAEVSAIYDANYWRAGGNHQLELIDKGIALANFDAGVNMGIGTAAQMLQRAAGVAADGKIGPGTLAAVAAANRPDLLRRMLEEREKRYRTLASSSTYARWLNTWLGRVQRVRTAATPLLGSSGAPGGSLGGMAGILLAAGVGVWYFSR